MPLQGKKSRSKHQSVYFFRHLLPPLVWLLISNPFEVKRLKNNCFFDTRSLFLGQGPPLFFFRNWRESEIVQLLSNPSGIRTEVGFWGGVNLMKRDERINKTDEGRGA